MFCYQNYRIAAFKILVTLHNPEHNQKTISIKFVAIHTIKDQKGFVLYKMMMAEADTSFPKRYRNKKERFSYVLWKVYIYMKSIIFIARLLGQTPVHL